MGQSSGTRSRSKISCLFRYLALAPTSVQVNITEKIFPESRGRQRLHPRISGLHSGRLTFPSRIEGGRMIFCNVPMSM